MTGLISMYDWSRHRRGEKKSVSLLPLVAPKPMENGDSPGQHLLPLLDQVRAALRLQHYSLRVKTLLDTLERTPWITGHLLYGAGLRLRECLRLRVKDIDFSANGKKERLPRKRTKKAA
ncbi:MAG: hypothetical protein AB7P69_20335 [Candidatus Binatia bacterium]